MEINNQYGQESPSNPQPKLVNIAITVVKDRQTGELRLNLEPATVDLTVNQQAAWRCNDGRLEIRFAPNSAPFATASYKTAQGGTILSGAPTRDKVSVTPYAYTLLVTTPAGFFIKQDADLRAIDSSTPPRPPAGGNQGKGCLTLLGFGLLYGLLSKIRAML
ncbi:MAG: hypothetical protein ACKVZH_14060 [Blastocatellia bacterium]